jgi:endonuclease/exonuclease/phosphatase family metal-dependent hydrolase
VSDRVRVITYNIRKGKGPNGRTVVDMERIGGALAEREPDVIMCQEVFHCARTGDSQSGNLASTLGLSGYYGANKFRSVGHHGNTTLTHLTVERFENHDISTNRVERRGALYCKLQLDGTPLHIFNLHLGLNRWQRAKQMRMVGELAQQVSGGHEPILMAGDFNDWRGDIDRYVRHELGFDNPFEGHDPAEVRTWHARRPVFNLDRIYTRHLQPVLARRLDGAPWNDLSDHLPLMAEFQPR